MEVEVKIEIDKNVPVPILRKKSPWVKVLEEMEDGDSVKTSKRSADRFYVAAKGAGHKITRRSLNEKETRCWMIKKKKS